MVQAEQPVKLWKRILSQLWIIISVTGPFIFASWDSFVLQFLVVYIVIIIGWTALTSIVVRFSEILLLAIITALIISAILLVFPDSVVGVAGTQYASPYDMIAGLIAAKRYVILLGVAIGILSALAICTSLTIGLMIGISRKARARFIAAYDTPSSKHLKDHYVGMGLSGIFLLTFIITSIITLDPNKGFKISVIIGILLIAVPLFVILMFFNITLWGGEVGRVLGRGLDEFSQASPYLKVMMFPVLGFAFVYFIIVVLFAGLFSAIYQVDHNSSFHVPSGSELRFWDFLFFSIMTITTQGYSDLKPKSLFAQALVSLETLLGIAWTLVVFAALIAHLESRHTR